MVTTLFNIKQNFWRVNRRQLNHSRLGAHKSYFTSTECMSTTSSLPSTLVICLHTCTRSESHAIPSPHHLSWLALDTYKALFRNEEVRYIHVTSPLLICCLQYCKQWVTCSLVPRPELQPVKVWEDVALPSETILSHYIMCRTVSLVTWRSWLRFVCCCTQLVSSPHSQLMLL